ncbi:SulP family inorganic anion transporter [Paraflavitalea sp. CAU 1676]|uniref:SulP family inorganic anion transporter n=1 Tax=Paraflavitalea sp. CAU 1676 TaxID=3032598 RepID=UPI0023DA25E0|nr:SulP family inorganic anion transporter [Paraflavitalea sp. CAU 1676]MDF2186968.1 SulP family inorganic anion transporter [Paraflavitalea sp. CAU 1676]
MVQKPKSYLKSLGSDLPSSVVVFLVALPLCLGIAIGSGAPPFSGLIAGIVGGIVIGALSGSQLSVSGPAAGLTTIVLAAITKLQVYEAFLLAVVLAGVIQIALGYLKAGVLGDYIPGAAIKGMLAAIGLILILKQIPHLVGDEGDYEGDEAFNQPDGKNTFTQVFYAFKHIMPMALAIGLLSLVIMIVWEKISKKSKVLALIPSAMIVVVVSVLINEWLQTNRPDLALGANHLVSIPKAETAGEFLSFFTHPDFSYLGNITVWTSAFTIAIIASLETLLNIEASDELDPYKRVTPTNRELKAQGVGNLVSGLIGGLPLTSVVVRTSANINSGAKTKISAISHGVLLLLCVALIPGLLSMIPFSALAAVLIFTGYKLTKPALYIKYFKKGLDQFLPFVITVVAILLTDLLVGILIGCCVGLIFVLRSNFKSAVFVVNDENKYLFRLRKDVSFLNKPIIKRKLEEVPADSYVLIDAARADFIDKDVIEVIEDFQKHAPLKNITVELKKSVYKEQGFNTHVPRELVLSKN